MSGGEVQGRIELDSPEIVDEAFRSLDDGHGVLFIGLHLGAMELPALYATHRVGPRVMAPMETIGNPPLQAHLTRLRSAPGVQVVPLEGAGQALRAWLRRGQIAGVVADRDVLGTGRPVTLFGRTTRLPVGGALLAAGSRAPVYAIAVRRTGFGDYAARLMPIERSGSGTFKEQVDGLLAAQAAAYERLIADAPDQWWTVLFPIWPTEDRDGD